LATWKANGAKDTYQLAREKVRGCAKQPPKKPLPAATQARLDEITAAF